jgi:hypothetical protein
MFSISEHIGDILIGVIFMKKRDREKLNIAFRIVAIVILVAMIRGIIFGG